MFCLSYKDEFIRPPVFGRVITLRSEKHLKQVNTICEQSAELLITMQLEIHSCQWALSCN